MKKTIRLMSIAIVLTLAAIMLSVIMVRRLNNRTVSGWGDDSGGRPSYTYEEINRFQSQGLWDNKIIFNSISNSTIGNEKNFVSVYEYDSSNSSEDTRNTRNINVNNGQEYILRLYVHNSNPNGWGGVAENVKASFSIPNISSKQIRVSGFIYSDNATPNQYWDSVYFNSDQAFHLEYIYGSARLENNSISKNGYQLSDEVLTVSGGTQIGYNDLDGRIPGGYEYVSYVSIRVKAVFDPEYTIDVKARLVGDTEWVNELDANIGDKVEFQIQYENTTTDSNHINVMVEDVLPKNMSYIEGSTILFNDYHENGGIVTQDTITDGGINIGNYPANAKAYVRFTAEIVDNILQSGGNVLANWAQISVGQSARQNFAVIYVEKS